MKKLLILTLFATLGGIPARADTTPPTTTTTGTTAATFPFEGVGEKWRKKLEAMTPEERKVFLESHPRIRERLYKAMHKTYEGLTAVQQQQYRANHPEFAQRLSSAAEAGPGIKDPGHPRVNEVNGREENQQQRIAQGVADAHLTPGQDAHLEKGEQRIRGQEAQDLAKNGGFLTKGEKEQLNHEENRESHRIYRDKHEEKK